MCIIGVVNRATSVELTFLLWTEGFCFLALLDPVQVNHKILLSFRGTPNIPNTTDIDPYSFESQQRRCPDPWCPNPDSRLSPERTRMFLVWHFYFFSSFPISSNLAAKDAKEGDIRSDFSKELKITVIQILLVWFLLFSLLLFSPNLLQLECVGLKVAMLFIPFIWISLLDGCVEFLDRAGLSWLRVGC